MAKHLIEKNAIEITIILLIAFSFFDEDAGREQRHISKAISTERDLIFHPCNQCSF